MDTIAVGRIIHVQQNDSRYPDECRPAIIVKVWNPDSDATAVQAVVFCDGSNDYADGRLTSWRTSIQHADHAYDPNSGFHWPQDCAAGVVQGA